jgi:heptosyltransferase-3
MRVLARESRALLYCAGGGLGDSLLATVVARALRCRYAAVDALTLPAHAEALAHVPDLDGVLVDDGGDEAKLAAQLHDRRYDAAIVTWATARTARVPQLAGIPLRSGQARRLYSWRFTSRVHVRSEHGDVTSHWTQILLDYARALGCDTDDPRPRFVATGVDCEDAAALLREIAAPRDVAIVHATNAIAPQRGIWPVEGWIDLVRALASEFECTVLLTGTQADREITGPIAAASGAIDLAGRTTIGSFAALAARARLFAGITTGSMHVAAATGVPTVGIFPFQSDVPERWAPQGARTAVVRASYPCRAGERKETCPDYACIAHLDVARILAAARSLLARVGAS